MLRRLLTCLGLALAFSNTTPVAAQDTPQAVETSRSVVNTYCVTCHNQTLKTAGLLLDTMDITNPAMDAPTWEKVIRKLRGNLMPPTGMPRPDDGTKDSLVSYLETELDHAAQAAPNPGNPAIHRLNRTEYTNAVRDLLAIDTDAFDIPSLLPSDDSGYGFDNIADVLTVSNTLMEAYLSAAQKISRHAIGDPSVSAVPANYEIPLYIIQDEQMSEDLPLGSRGGAVIGHHFPLDAEYDITVRLQRNKGRAGRLNVIFGFAEYHQFDLLVDGKRVRRFTVGGEKVATKTQAEEDERDAGLKLRVTLPAGTHDIGVAFLNQLIEPEYIYQPQIPDYSKAISYGFLAEPAIGEVTIDGPFNATGLGDTASRQTIFSCRPNKASEELSCATEILGELARRAYRRPVTEQDLKALLDLYQEGRRQNQQGGSFEAGIETALQRILVDPEFLFRIEHQPDNVAADTPYNISDLELASRLSFFLWSSIPDDELLEVAEQGELSDPVVLEQQVRRMLADPRSSALIENFAGQWLYLRNVQLSWPNPYVFPEFIANVRDDFQQETELFIASLINEDRSVLDLLDADYTFLNERLARHYGVPDVYGNHFRRVTLSDNNRRGLLGQGSILMVTSYATRTAPTIRGKWLLENIMGTPPPPPPADVPSLTERTGSDGKLLTMRQQMEAHRGNPVCASCHRVMDPLGFAMENLDATGQWRDTDSGKPIDASGIFPDGTEFEGPTELRQLLLSNPEPIVHTATEKLLTYAVGRGLEYYDEPVLREIVRQAKDEDYAWSSIILGIVKSMPFQMRRSSL